MMMTRGEDGPKGEEKPPGVVVTPNGAMFAPRAVRPGILPRLLSEHLDTRVMVKSCLKDAPADANARRRALKRVRYSNFDAAKRADVELQHCSEALLMLQLGAHPNIVALHYCVVSERDEYLVGAAKCAAATAGRPSSSTLVLTRRSSVPEFPRPISRPSTLARDPTRASWNYKLSLIHI